MALIQDSVSVAANTTIADQLVNNVLSVVRGIFVVDYGIVASVTGITASVEVGTSQVAPNFSPSIINRFPIFPDDFGGRFGVIPNDRILLRLVNGTGGAITVFYAFRFNPMGNG